MHIIDSTLQIPLSFPQTITKANLEFLVALLTKGNWIVPGNLANKLALETPDLTILGPNSPDFGADWKGWDGKPQEELDRVFMYHAFPGVRYADTFNNGTEMKSVMGENVVVHEYSNATDGVVFINDARLKTVNYLTANGVLHVIDRPLDPGGKRGPSENQIEAITGKARKVATGIIVGVVIGIVALMVGVALVVALRRRVKKKREYQVMPPDYQSAVRDAVQGGRGGVELGMGAERLDRLSAPLPARPTSVASRVASLRGTLWPSRQETVIELDGKDGFTHVSELGARSPPMQRTPPELDGRERRSRSMSGRSRVSITFHGERPRHIGFQAQY